MNTKLDDLYKYLPPQCGFLGTLKDKVTDTGEPAPLLINYCDPNSKAILVVAMKNAGQYYIIRNLIASGAEFNYAGDSLEYTVLTSEPEKYRKAGDIRILPYVSVETDDFFDDLNRTMYDRENGKRGNTKVVIIENIDEIPIESIQYILQEGSKYFIWIIAFCEWESMDKYRGLFATRILGKATVEDEVKDNTFFVHIESKWKSFVSKLPLDNFYDM